MTRRWRHKLTLAQAEVEATLKSLPQRLQQAASRVPVTYEHRPSPALSEDGIEPDTLGLFVGEAFPEAEAGFHPLPPQVLLFLDNLWDLAEGDEAVFREEIRTTLLHELGHYLGLDEADLEERGLE